jgi:hypothetical protein
MSSQSKIQNYMRENSKLHAAAALSQGNNTRYQL